jgi:glycerol-3-phosphate dehydrogenase
MKKATTEATTETTAPSANDRPADGGTSEPAPLDSRPRVPRPKRARLRAAARAAAGVTREPRPGPARHVLIIGGGGTGGALAHDLILRGLRVTLVERGEVTSGTTGRHHGLLHSGARYVTTDRAAAIDCIGENKILRRIAPGSFEENDGLFVALWDDDPRYAEEFLNACWQCAVPARRIEKDEALRLEPGLNPDLRFAVVVPDATMDAMRVPLRFFATARRGGADIRPFTEVVSVTVSAAGDGTGRTVSGVKVRDHAAGREYEIGADIVVNAAGPWVGKVAELAGVSVPVVPSPGVMVAVRGRHTNMVVNRLHPPGDGDIVLPQRLLTIVGTSSWIADDPDDLTVPAGHVETIIRESSLLVPAIGGAEVRASWAAVRPLIGVAPRSGSDAVIAAVGRDLARITHCFDHATDATPTEGFVTIGGGKATTLRAMAEVAADVVCAKLGVDQQCQTRETVLLPHTAWYTA